MARLALKLDHNKGDKKMADARTLEILKEHLNLDLPALNQAGQDIKEIQRQELAEAIKQLEAQH